MIYKITQEQANKIRKGMKAINDKFSFRQIEVLEGGWDYIVTNKETNEKSIFAGSTLTIARTKALDFAVNSL